MELVGANADFRAQAKFPAVVKPGAGIDYHCRAIDHGGKPPRGRQIACDDRVCELVEVRKVLSETVIAREPR